MNTKIAQEKIEKADTEIQRLVDEQAIRQEVLSYLNEALNLLRTKIAPSRENAIAITHIENGAVWLRDIQHAENLVAGLAVAIRDSAKKELGLD